MAMNTWEAAAYQYEGGSSADAQAALFYPGMYCRDDYNMVHILAQIEARPNPQIQLGPVDLSCPMILCDLSSPDEPIVYANQPFSDMTGYTLDEIKGRNCRFLQSPDGNVMPKSKRRYVDRDTIRKMRKAINKQQEVQVTVQNFKKSGKPFTNVLTMIPIAAGGQNLCIGFQCEQE